MTHQLDIVDDIRAAQIRQRIGLDRCEQSAGELWIQTATTALADYAFAVYPGTFLAEQCRQTLCKAGLDAPPNLKAWGAVILRARRYGLIKAVGYGPACSSNGSPKTLWRAVVEQPG